MQHTVAPVLKVWVDGHGRRPGTYFQGWTAVQPLLGPMQFGRRPSGVYVVNEMSGLLYRPET